ncbi:LamG-like jellyroll fold domain-containing protein [Pontixanthobacter sp. CEM42]|uniref:LamG-like jellyroll fold domain-containing protein n=1 Tax=Pontixanthobacter sp. CEM42 TaxID=2792077 RepID=UPI001ADFCCBD|nr:LamG-like jellyroll fold domain-containing protein [Pontixanthobacter sp. CEM42]
MKSRFTSAMIALAVAMAPTVALAQSYTPDVLEVSETGPIAFDPSPKLDLSDGGAIEFWVAANWPADPGYDPPVIINIGPDGILYQVSILRDRDGLVFANANDEDVFIGDLSDGNLHHVALNIMEDGVEVYLDGALIGTSDLLPLSLPSAGLFVGGLETEESASLDGAVGQLRFWSQPLKEDEIIDFRLREVLDPQSDDHPAAEYLVAQSDFREDELLVVESIEKLP